MQIIKDGVELANGSLSAGGQGMIASLNINADVAMRRDGNNLVVTIGIAGVTSIDMVVTMDDIKSAKNAMPNDIMGLLMKVMFR